MSFKSALSAVGHFLAKAFSPQAIAVEASIADLAFPQFKVLTDMTANAVINAEVAAIAASKQGGSGAQKLALVTATIQDQYNQVAKQMGIPVEPQNVKNYVSAIVAALNAFPAPAAAQPTPEPAPAPSPNIA